LAASISKLILIGPPPSPLLEASSAAAYARAETVRTKVVASVVEAIVTAGKSEKNKTSNPLAMAAVRMSLLGQDPESYAKSLCSACCCKRSLFCCNTSKTLIVTGSEDKVSPPQLCEKHAKELKGNASLQVLENVGLWHVFENWEGVANVVEKFL
jgi:pimeloyl-ACP methyl ester carboxylesterase